MTDRTWYLIVVAVFGVILAAVVFGFAVSVAAQIPDDVDIPIDTILRGESGDTFLVATVTSSPGLACDAFLDGRNNESVHPNTDVLIQSGVNFAAILNVESGAFNTGSTSFISGGLIEVFIRIGPDGVSSTGFILTLDCQPHIDPPPVVDEGTTTTITTTTTPTVTTTTPPPINGPNTGFGSCADGACAGWSLSPLQTWILIGVVWSLLAGLAWAFVHGATRGSDG